ncbi:spore germination protein, partial [Heliobacterium chlorum]|uniref:spore germination protein n=1 Tax=Heliobacterium chlorum TaxID=2698 RepID=UPI003C6CA97F
MFYSLRLVRLFVISLAAIFGFYGVLLGLIGLLSHLVSLKSLGVPFLSPISPYNSKGGSVLIRTRSYLLHRRPPYLRPLDPKKQSLISRPWSPDTPRELFILAKERSSSQRKEPL